MEHTQTPDSAVKNSKSRDNGAKLIFSDQHCKDGAFLLLFDETNITKRLHVIKSLSFHRRLHHFNDSAIIPSDDNWNAINYDFVNSPATGILIW